MLYQYTQANQIYFMTMTFKTRHRYFQQDGYHRYFSYLFNRINKLSCSSSKQSNTCVLLAFPEKSTFMNNPLRQKYATMFQSDKREIYEKPVSKAKRTI
tara:strand:+ start:423 stop:719 length:297 start_codon:yes stop_codon:yes gene_type:complete